MMRSLKVLLVICVVGVPFLFGSLSSAIPPKPGPDFIWVEPHTAPDGTFIKGHWQYTGPPQKGKIWVSGHYNAAGEWVIGHWKDISAPKPGAVWVPGHRGPRGRWIPGHWR